MDARPDERCDRDAMGVSVFTGTHQQAIHLAELLDDRGVRSRVLPAESAGLWGALAFEVLVSPTDRNGPIVRSCLDQLEAKARDARRPTEPTRRFLWASLGIAFPTTLFLAAVPFLPLAAIAGYTAWAVRVLRSPLRSRPRPPGFRGAVGAFCCAEGMLLFTCLVDLVYPGRGIWG